MEKRGTKRLDGPSQLYHIMLNSYIYTLGLLLLLLLLLPTDPGPLWLSPAVSDPRPGLGTTQQPTQEQVRLCDQLFLVQARD